MAIVVLPSVSVTLVSYFVQAHRYNVNEGIGCVPATYWEKEAILGLLAVPLLLALLSFCYSGQCDEGSRSATHWLIFANQFSGLAIYNFISQRRRFQSLLQQNSPTLNSSRFFRLLAVSAFDMLVNTPAIVWTLSFQTRNIQPTLSWADVHYNFGLVFNISEAQAQSARGAYYATMISHWLPLVASFAYFLCFGMHDGVLARVISSTRGVSSMLSNLQG